ncbi:MAG: hypothetical protein ACRDMJ_16305 [Solirubrobacteraceae bacterium]
MSLRAALSGRCLDPRRRRVATTVLLALITVTLAAVWAPSPARADGDPASDVLAAQNVFLPSDAGGSLGQQQRLTAVVRQAADRGLSIRVAVISSPADLGSVSALWRRPQTYAAFLGEELSLMFSGRLLVVMPDGFGLYHAHHATSTELAALRGASRTGSSLTTAATDAVRRLAAVAGHPLPRPTAGAEPSRQPAGGGVNVLSWVVLVGGAGLIVLAWAVSLRAVPPRRVQYPRLGR